MEPTTEQKEAEAEKAAETDASAMEKLMQDTLDQQPPPDETPPAEDETAPAQPETKPAREETPSPPEPSTAAAKAKVTPEQDDFEQDLAAARRAVGR